MRIPGRFSAPRGLAVALLVLVGWMPPSAAEPIDWSNVRTDIIRDGTIGPPGRQRVYEDDRLKWDDGDGGGYEGDYYLIPRSFGERHGNNLFHSFERFDVGAEDGVLFTGPGTHQIANVIARVIGGEPSRINGSVFALMDEEAAKNGNLVFRKANFYFLNPQGVMFGSDAKVAVGGAFHLSSADYLDFRDENGGGRLYAGLYADKTKTLDLEDSWWLAPPSSFGFLREEPGPLSFEGSSVVIAKRGLSVLGGEILVTGDGDWFDYSGALAVSRGPLWLGSVASPGEVRLENQAAFRSSVGAFDRLGNIEVRDAAVLCSGARCILDPKTGEPLSGFVGAPGSVAILGGSVVLGVRDGSVDPREGGFVWALTPQPGPEGAEVVIEADTLEMHDGSEVFASSARGFVPKIRQDGRLGRVGIDVGSLKMSGASEINAGDWQAFSIKNPQKVDGGVVVISATDSIELSGSDKDYIFEDQTEISAVSLAARAGRVVIDAPDADLSLYGNAGIYPNSYAPPEPAPLDGSGSSAAGDDAPGVDIHVKNLKMKAGAEITTNARGNAKARDLRIHAVKSISLFGSDKQVELFESARDALVACASGGSCEDVAMYRSQTEGWIDAFNVCVDGGSCEGLDTDETVIAGLSLDGSGGSASISLEAGTGITVTHGAVVNSATLGSGAAGSVVLEAPLISLSDGAAVRSDSLAQGDGSPGAITLDAEEEVTVDSAAVVTSTGRKGSGGSISIISPSVRILNGGIVDSSTVSSGSAGGVLIQASDRLVVRGSSEGVPSIVSSSTLGRVQVENQSGLEAGDAGEIQLFASDAWVDGAWILAFSDAAGGDAGRILISAPGELSVVNDGQITTRTEGLGRGGDIDLDVARLRMGNGASISAQSAGEADAGRVTIGTEGGRNPTQSVLLSKSRIETSADDAGGGDITLDLADSLILEEASGLTASVKAGEGGVIRVEAPSYTVLRDGSEISAEAAKEPGTGGRITIRTGAFVKSPDSKVSASAPGGPEFQGVVEITSPEVDVESQVTPLETAFLDAAALLRPVCAARATGGESGSFTVARRRGLPTSPEGLLLAFDEVGGEALGEEIAGEDEELPSVAAAAGPPAAGSLQVASVSLAQGASAFRGGHFEEAEKHLSEASALYAEIGDLEARLDAIRALAQAQQAAGRYAESVETLAEALRLAEGSGDPARIASLHGSLGNAYLALGRPEAAEQQLRRGIELAQQAGDPALAARLLTNLGNERAAVQAYASALEAYEQSAQLAGEASRSVEEARALSNAARAAIEAGETERAIALLARARARAATLADTHEKAAMRIHLARSYQRVARASPARRAASLLAAHEELMAAIGLAKELDVPRTLSYALGNLGGLYQSEGRVEEALYLTRKALRVAQEAEASEALYRWHWQEGQLLWAQGRAGEALQAYRRAVEILEETRQETLAQYGSAALHFRRAVSPVYLDFVDTLLQGSGMLRDPAASTRLLFEARAVMEQLKAAELRDYFRDECVAEIEARAKPLDQIAAGAAVVYPILLPERLELLVSLPSGLERHTLPVPAERVAAEVAAFQRGLMRQTRFEYRPHAETLYDWLVRPYAERLEAQKVKTLIFVPGGALRTIPMAALHDGAGFLVSRYAVAVTPGLSLVDPKPLDPERARPLLAGLSESTQGFPELPHAARELAAIRELYGGEVLLDADFEAKRFEAELTARQPSMVHVASHAVFTGDPATSFLLTHDSRLTMDEISQAVAPTQFQAQPLELLALSGCETAAGDERAALGLAGVAIRAGARSALGSLWRIQDEATYELVVGFYEELKDPAVSKAEALRRAQLRLLEGRRFAHPFYWSPFLLISNWL